MSQFNPHKFIRKMSHNIILVFNNVRRRSKRNSRLSYLLQISWNFSNLSVLNRQRSSTNKGLNHMNRSNSESASINFLTPQNQTLKQALRTRLKLYQFHIIVNSVSFFVLHYISIQFPQFRTENESQNHLDFFRVRRPSRRNSYSCYMLLISTNISNSSIRNRQR